MGISRAVLTIVLVLVCTVLPVAAAAATAPPFTLELFDGRMLRLADLRGTAVILLFWAQW